MQRTEQNGRWIHQFLPEVISEMPDQTNTYQAVAQAADAFVGITTTRHFGCLLLLHPRRMKNSTGDLASSNLLTWVLGLPASCMHKRAAGER